MAAPMKQKPVQKVKQKFSYCELCRHSHDKGKKHAFFQRHRDKVKTVLGKYGAKVKLAKQDMKEPYLVPGSFEPDLKYWCYMCSCEVSKHISDGEVTVRHANFIEHLMSAEHAQNVDRFWRVNRIETDLQAKFVFSDGAKEDYRKAVEAALTRHDRREERLLSQSAAKIRRLESNRQQSHMPSSSSTTPYEPTETLLAPVAPSGALPASGHLESTRGWTGVPGIGTPREAGADDDRDGPRSGLNEELPGCSAWTNSQMAEVQNQGALSHPAQRNPTWSEPSASGLNQMNPASTGSSQYYMQTTGRFTVAANQPPSKPGVLNKVKTIGVISSGGLTAISVKDRGVVGNIHTGARPPWLQHDNDDEDSPRGSQVGPSEDDFRKHLEQQRKSKLNPKRVGANFDHASPSAEEWLPSFGRVWNAGRRWQSRRQYRKEASKTRNQPSPSTAGKTS